MSLSNKKQKKKTISACAVFQNSSVVGYVTLLEDLDKKDTIIQAHLSHLKPNREYAWHIHEAGDLRPQKCKGACSHYNPYGKKHGSLTSKERHVGDLGNLKTNSRGESKTRIRTKSVKLRGKYSVVGRSVVIHEKSDDLGLGGTTESLKTGSAGGRIACGVIGYASNSQLYF